MDCLRCGACCVAPDIAALDKPIGVPCPRLGADNLCTQYDCRPAVCRSYEPDEVCHRIAAPSREERVGRYLELFGLLEEARRVRESGARTMTAARALTRRP